ncbi:uncharacterized protein TRIADDRAFT_18188 [Trichoplax adhaerens]|uniref:triacylglycerol lipase n=1 Tax=Trichoplax adhaerens TaxID=10228 RepID=B3RJ95_TRIAD|nr:hypothetical protein TRIADDRAFT_18188 [Trichoplax adhaerens]EDV29289.1 hypothetical protein TRIADDRAFT_18188 [Trichoplax adhaerens]|eukprot:XP_002108491.1 hypothetical protein TRIADDRAFT_18188 [Trichoplax adhaerens]
MNLSLAGCGFLGLYHLGVVSCLKEHAPQFVNSLRSVSGASAGALSGLVLLVDCPLGLITNEMMKVVKSIRSSSLGPYNPKFNITKTLSALLASFAPDNVHEIVSGRLFISLTRLSDMQNVMISEFHSKNDLIEALCTSSFVPIWSGMTPIIYRGEHYIDGGFSDNQPQPFGQNTILVSPFYGESDICPNDNSMSFHQFCCNNTNIQVSLSNIYRLSRALFPPEPRVLRSMCQQGYLDALRFLQNKMAGYCKYQH